MTDKVVKSSGLKVLQAEKGAHFQGLIPIGDDRYRTPNRKERREKAKKARKAK